MPTRDTTDSSDHSRVPRHEPSTGLKTRWSRALLIVGWCMTGVLLLGLADRIVFGHRHLQGVHLERLLAGELRVLPRAIGFLGGYLLVALLAALCGFIVGPLRRRAAAALILVSCVTAAAWIASEFRPYGLLGRPAADEWRQYRSPEGDFTVLMLGEPEIQELREDSAFGPVQMRILTYDRAETYLSLVVERYPEPGFFDRQATAILDDERARMLLRLKANVADESELTYQGFPARTLRLVMSERGMVFVLKGRIIVTPDRVFRLAASAGDDEARVDLASQFFDSLVIKSD
jgi:hypothetical protein